MMKWIYAVVLALMSYTADVHAQGDQFCRAIQAILHDGPNQFRNIRGKMIKAEFNMTSWQTGIKVPGTISSRFVKSMGMFYEGAVLQTRNIADVGPVYERYKNLLSECLVPKGYIRSSQENFCEGMGAYQKLVFMQDMKESEMPTTPPPHVVLEALYSKPLGLYTVVIYVFEN